jgi:beta-glucosidase
MENKQTTKKLFPKNFFWGASVASHQVEGGTINQWSVWELAHAQELAKNSHKKLKYLPRWEDIKKYAEDPNNYVSGKGVDHYNKFREDFDILKKLELNSFRFGVEWSRIEPEEGVWNQEAIEHYHLYIDELKKRGIAPIMNIWHWTMPTWFTDKGGFKKYSNIKFFDQFIEKIADEYSNKIDYVITLNEPNVYASYGYLNGQWPPQEKNFFAFLKVYWILTKAHKHSYKILKSKNPQINVGVAAQLSNIQAKRPHNILDELSTKWMRYFWNWWFLKRITKQQDFVGINYYFTDYYTGRIKLKNPEIPLNDLGWYMEPEGLYPLLLRTWVRFKKPIIITENGVADALDQYRQWWIEETIIAIERALSEGVDVRGYFHWSLLDNFEWAYGWWPKFGLVAVDRKQGMKRTIRPSAIWYSERLRRL